jgi:hypothetical protein
MASVFAEFRVLIAPGLHNSGPDHWQSRWQRLFPAFERVQQDDWEARSAALVGTCRSLRQRDTRPDADRGAQLRRAGHGAQRGARSGRRGGRAAGGAGRSR